MVVACDGKSKDSELWDVTADSSLLEVLAPSNWKTKEQQLLRCVLMALKIFLNASTVSPLMLLQPGGGERR
jgi:hypothetical protein